MDNNNLYVRKNMHHTTVTLLVTSLVIVLVIFISIGYSAINASLKISGDLEYYPIKDLYSLIANSSKGLDDTIDLYNYNFQNEPSGVYKMYSTNNDKFPVYYYHGNVSDNNIKFAGFCWLIVRTTSTGGIKLIYNGTISSRGVCNGDYAIKSSKFNDTGYNSFDFKSYYGYTALIDSNIESEIKKNIDEWYSKNMIAYTTKLEDTEWCNDRTQDTDGQYKAASDERRRKPSVQCSDSRDKYTVSSSKGNGLLKYPIGLLTVDEVRLAGYRKYTMNGITYDKSYLDGEYYYSNGWWLLSPAQIYKHTNTDGEISQYIFNGDQYSSFDDLFYTDINDEMNIRPAISLISGTKVSSGNGTNSNPYQILGDE